VKKNGKSANVTVMMITEENLTSMKNIFSIGFKQQYFDLWLLALRVLVGLFMLTHGLPKFYKLMEGGEVKFGDPIGLGPTVSLVLTVFAEMVCSTFILIGLGTRIAVIPLIITMLVITFVVHANDPFGDKEPAFLYLFTYVTLLVAGSGRYSIDYVLSRSGKVNKYKL
jgi:putative oxidoreductase